MAIVHLDAEDVVAAMTVTTFKTLESRFRKAKPKNGQMYEDCLTDNLAGYLAEAAVAKMLRLQWPQPHTLLWSARHDGDLLHKGQVLEVRATKKPYVKPHLLAQPDDHDDRFYVLVSPRDPHTHTFRVVGGIMGADMKREEWWGERVNGRACFWVPAEALVPFGPKLAWT
tara:strand:+ start:4918 stop:5427 length:510 start_codon:yes stop_codon:yes gene_type:complete